MGEKVVLIEDVQVYHRTHGFLEKMWRFGCCLTQKRYRRSQG